MADSGQVIMKSSARNNRCRTLLANEEMSDVTFLVGHKKVPIKANTIMLRHGSSVFYKMLAPKEKEQYIYEISDLEPLEFRKILDYFYTGELNMDMKFFDDVNVNDLFQGATLYGAVDLIDQCVLKLTDSLNINNCAATLVLALKNKNIQLENAAIESICKNAYEIFQPSFGNFHFTEEALLKILPMDELIVDEFQLFQTVLQWGKKQIRKNRNMDNNELVDPKDLRCVLEKLLKYIRFPLIDPSDFRYKVYPTGVLTDLERMAIRDERTNYMLKMFNPNPRRTLNSSNMTNRKPGEDESKIEVNTSLLHKLSLDTPIGTKDKALVFVRKSPKDYEPSKPESVADLQNMAYSELCYCNRQPWGHRTYPASDGSFKCTPSN